MSPNRVLDEACTSLYNEVKKSIYGSQELDWVIGKGPAIDSSVSQGTVRVAHARMLGSAVPLRLEDTVVTLRVSSRVTNKWQTS